MAGKIGKLAGMRPSELNKMRTPKMATRVKGRNSDGDTWEYSIPPIPPNTVCVPTVFSTDPPMKSEIKMYKDGKLIET